MSEQSGTSLFDSSADDSGFSLLNELTNDNFELSPCVVSVTGNSTNGVAQALEESSSHDFQVETEPPQTRVKKLQPREVYLVTYSQADVLKVKSKSDFAQLVVSQFDRNDKVVQQWVSSVELHRESGVHYHLAIKLNKGRRFKQVRENIFREHGINLDFSEWHDNYYSAYTYVTKYDTHFETSEGHPVLKNPPATAKATATKRSLAQEFQSCPSGTKVKKAREFKPPRLNSQGVAEIIRENNIKSEKELYAFAKMQSNEGKKDLQSYLYNHPNLKHHGDLISTV